MEQKKKKSKTTKKEKDAKYNPEGKFGGEYDYDLGLLISGAIKSGKIKVDSPVDEDK